VKAADITQPEPIVLFAESRRRTFQWERLDPAKSQYGAAWGLRGPHGFAALIWDHPAYDKPTLTCCGRWSGLYPGSLYNLERDLDRVVRTGRNDDSDDRITKAKFDSWK
jgi:hypothetical protein